MSSPHCWVQEDWSSYLTDHANRNKLRASENNVASNMQKYEEEDEDTADMPIDNVVRNERKYHSQDSTNDTQDECA